MSNQEDPQDTHLEDLEPPRGVRGMALFRWLLIMAMAFVALLSVSYSMGAVGSGGASAAATRYQCPMHPQIVQDHPGECPICGMTLVPIDGAGAKKPKAAHAKGDQRRSSAAPTPSEGVPGLVPVELTLDRVQLIGIRTAPATKEKLSSELRTVGYVAADEAKLARVHTRFSGWIEDLAVATTGQKVRRGQVLASVYNVELLPAQQEFLTARRWGASSAGPLEQDARTRLEILGMSRGEIDRIAKTGKPSRTVAVTSPINGYVTAKQAVQGAFVQPGTQLFEIADLSRVWVLADVSEYEMGRVAVGQSASVELAGDRGQRLEGKVGFIYPVLDPSTRTLRLRVELGNEDLKLKPGMYADVILAPGDQQGVAVAREALIDTGKHQYVFVSKEGGRFEPRHVKVGARSDDKVQIVEGLADGEIVVTTANFLIDSESRLRAAIQGAPAEHEH